MILFIIGLILLIISCVLFVYIYKYKSKINTINKDIENENYILQLHNQNLKEKENEINCSIKNKMQELNDLSQSIEKDFENKKALSHKAFENYCDVLDNNYKEKEREYQESLSLLGVSYEK